MKTAIKKTVSRTVAFRISEELFRTYEAEAIKERRRISDVFRFALEDHIAEKQADQSQEKAVA